MLARWPLWLHATLKMPESWANIPIMTLRNSCKFGQHSHRLLIGEQPVLVGVLDRRVGFLHPAGIAVGELREAADAVVDVDDEVARSQLVGSPHGLRTEAFRLRRLPRAPCR